MRITDLFLIVPEHRDPRHRARSSGATRDPVIILVLAALFWMYVARVVRGEVLSLKEKEFVEAARASGASPTRIIVRHILPNIIGPIMVNTTLGVAGGDHRRVDAVVPGLRRAAAADVVGQHALRRRGLRRDVDKSYLIYAPGLDDPASPCSRELHR